MRIKFSKLLKNEKGFSLVEAIIALVVLVVALLAVSSVFIQSIIYNSGNSDRSQAMSVLLDQTERLRSLRFSPTDVDPILKTSPAPFTATSEDGSSYTVEITITDLSTSLKEIKIKVIQPKTPFAWQTAMSVESVFRRAKSSI